MGTLALAHRYAETQLYSGEVPFSLPWQRLGTTSSWFRTRAIRVPVQGVRPVETTTNGPTWEVPKASAAAETATPTTTSGLTPLVDQQVESSCCHPISSPLTPTTSPRSTRPALSKIPPSSTSTDWMSCQRTYLPSETFPELFKESSTR